MIDGTLVLAAGKSTRISSLAGGLPRPLLAIAGRPIIVWNLAWLSSAGIRDAWINLHYQPDMIRTALGDGSVLGMNLYYSYEPVILGTAGTWRNLLSEWGPTTLVVYGDSLVRLNLSALTRAHAENDALATIAVFDPLRHLHTGIAGGRLSIDGAGHVEQFAEGLSDDGIYVNAGVYLINQRLQDRIPEGFVDFGCDVFPDLAREGLLNAWVMEPNDYCLGLDTPAAFMMVQTLVQKERIRLL